MKRNSYFECHQVFLIIDVKNEKVYNKVTFEVDESNVMGTVPSHLNSVHYIILLKGLHGYHHNTLFYLTIYSKPVVFKQFFL